jgi:histidyl-tRNA synthetase
MAELRRAGLRCDADYAGRSLKGQMTQASRLRARIVVQVVGQAATIREAGGERARDVPVAAIARELLGHPGPPPALERTADDRARGARTVQEEERSR